MNCCKLRTMYRQFYVFAIDIHGPELIIVKILAYLWVWRCDYLSAILYIHLSSNTFSQQSAASLTNLLSLYFPISFQYLPLTPHQHSHLFFPCTVASLCSAFFFPTRSFIPDFFHNIPSKPPISHWSFLIPILRASLSVVLLSIIIG